MDDARVPYAADRGRKNCGGAGTAGEPVHPRRGKVCSEVQSMHQKQAQQIGENDCQQQIKQHAQPIISDLFHHPTRTALRQEEGDQEREREKAVHYRRHRIVPAQRKGREPHANPSGDTPEEIVIHQNIKRCKKYSKHSPSAGRSVSRPVCPLFHLIFRYFSRTFDCCKWRRPPFCHKSKLYLPYDFSAFLLKKFSL